MGCWQELEKQRHLEVKRLWVQEAVRRRWFRIVKILGTTNPADNLTKPNSIDIGARPVSASPSTGRRKFDVCMSQAAQHSGWRRVLVKRVALAVSLCDVVDVTAPQVTDWLKCVRKTCKSVMLLCVFHGSEGDGWKLVHGFRGVQRWKRREQKEAHTQMKTAR